MSDFEEGFTFTWKIENFSMLPQQKGEELKSPTFIVETISDKTKWRLWLYPKGDASNESDNFLSLYLCTYDLDKNKTVPNINFSFTVESVDSALNKSLIFQNVDVIPEGQGFDQLLPLKSLYDNKNMYLPQDVLTVVCRIWSSHENGNTTAITMKCTTPGDYFEECNAKTTIDVQKRVLTWPITKIGELVNRKVKLSLNSVNSLESSPVLKLLFYIDKELNDRYAQIEIVQTKPSGKKRLFVKCKITVVNADIEQQTFYEDFHLFSLNPDEIWHFSDFISIDNIIDDKYIYIDDTMFLQCEFTFSHMGSEHHFELPVYMPNALPFQAKAATELTELSKQLGGLFAREKFCDVEIKADSKTFRCHKLILCAQSPVFSAMFENDMKEKETGVVEVTDLEPQTLEKLLNFLYLQVVEDGLPIDDICNLYSAADKYEIMLLQRRCSILLLSKLCVANLCRVLATADTHQDHFLLTHVNTFLSIHSREVFRSTEWEAFMVENPALSRETMIKICLE